MSLEFNVLVIGGGIVGLSAALAMAQRGYTVAVIDAGSLKIESSSSKDTRVYAINHASKMLLQRLGAWRHLDLARVSVYGQMHVWDAVSGAHIDFDSRYIAEPNLGAILEESVLKGALLEELALQPTVSLFPDTYIDELDCAEASCIKVYSQEQIWEGQLLMVADGAHSPARQKLKVELNSWSYEQHAIVAAVAVEKMHQQTAYQVFHPEGPLAFLPLADAHQCSIVWSTTPKKTKYLMALADEEFNEALTQAFAKKLGKATLISSRHQFPLTMRHVKHYTGTHWLLLGDAAHTIHPLAGLGLNVGLADVSSWMHCLDVYNKGVLLSQRALKAYQRERKHAVWQIVILMEGFKRLFSHSSVPLVALRGLGIGFCNEWTSIKRLFIQHAQGEVQE